MTSKKIPTTGRNPTASGRKVKLSYSENVKTSFGREPESDVVVFSTRGQDRLTVLYDTKSIARRRANLVANVGPKKVSTSSKE